VVILQAGDEGECVSVVEVKHPPPPPPLLVRASAPAVDEVFSKIFFKFISC
jgi:hypothetical protein